MNFDVLQRFRYRNVWILSLAMLGLFPESYLRAENSLFPRQDKPPLAQIQRVLMHVDARVHKETVETDSLVTIVAQRMSELGYSIVTQPSHPYDVKVEFSCLINDRLTVPGETGVDRDVTPLMPHVTGPPCLLQYAYRGRMMAWQRIDRVVYTLGVQVARRLQQEPRKQSPLTLFQRYLEQYDFPLLLTAEWGQTERLVKFLKHPNTARVRKTMMLSLLGEIRSKEAIPCLVKFLEDKDFVQPATLALGHFGMDVRSPLVDLLQSSPRVDVKAAAAHSLGRIGATTGDWSLVPLFVGMLQDPDLDIALQIELVWAIGKSPDRLALPILEKLYRQVWSIRSQDPQLEELRKAIDWSHRSVRLGGHTDAY